MKSAPLIALLCLALAGHSLFAKDYADTVVSFTTTNSGQYVYTVPTNEVLNLTAIEIVFSNGVTGTAKLQLQRAGVVRSTPVSESMSASTNLFSTDVSGIKLLGNSKDQILIDVTTCSEDAKIYLHGESK